MWQSRSGAAPPGRHEVRDNWSARQGCIRCDTGHALADCVGLVTGLLDGMPGCRARSCLLAASRRRDKPQYRRPAAGHRCAPARPAARPGQRRDHRADRRAAPGSASCAAQAAATRPGRGAPTAGASGSCAPTGPTGSASAPPAPRPTTCRSGAAAAGSKARVCARDPGGSAVCGRCRRADPAAWKPCGICGHDGWARITINGTRIGDCCYLHPHERCSACGIGRAVSPYKTRKATCAACATAPLAACSSCGLDAMVPSPDDACAARPPGGTRRRRPRHPTVRAPRRPQLPGCSSRPRAWPAVQQLGIHALQPEVTQGTAVKDARGCRGARNAAGSARAAVSTGRCCAEAARPKGMRRPRHWARSRWSGGTVRRARLATGRRCARKATAPAADSTVACCPAAAPAQDLCAGCAAPAGPVCGDCGNEDRCITRGALRPVRAEDPADRLLGSEPGSQRRGLQSLDEALLAAERPEAVIS